nr:TadE family protein [Streptomyces humicola]
MIRRRLNAARGDSGVSDSGMTAIEFVFLTPVLFFMIFATVQFALYFFADHVAQAAAQAGARKARAEADANPAGWQGEASSTADSYIQQLGPQLLEGVNVQPVSPAAHQVGIRITARVPSVFPGLDLTVDTLSQGPVERFVPDGGG